jgi:hypothetical protein
MTSEPQILLDHRYGTKSEGRRALFWGLLVPTVLIVAIHLFPNDMRHEDPIFYYVFVTLALVIPAAVVFLIAIPNLRMDREFRFVITEEQIECDCPAKAYGDTYTIPIREIVALEAKDGIDSANWWLVASDGRRLKVTTGYKNPVHKILTILRRLRPDLPEDYI